MGFLHARFVFFFTIKHLRLQIIEFYYQNACSVKQVHRGFFHFMVSLIDLLKRLFGLLWLNFAKNLHYWTLNHQHTYVKCELRKISELYRSQLSILEWRSARSIVNATNSYRKSHILVRFMGCRIIGPHFFKDAVNHNVTVNG